MGAHLLPASASSTWVKCLHAIKTILHFWSYETAIARLPLEKKTYMHLSTSVKELDPRKTLFYQLCALLYVQVVWFGCPALVMYVCTQCRILFFSFPRMHSLFQDDTTYVQSTCKCACLCVICLIVPIDKGFALFTLSLLFWFSGFF